MKRRCLILAMFNTTTAIILIGSFACGVHVGLACTTASWWQIVLAAVVLQLVMWSGIRTGRLLERMNRREVS